MPLESLMTSVTSHSYTTSQELQDQSTSSEGTLEEPLPSTSQSVSFLVTTTKRERKDFITSKLVATLDRCQLSIRDS